MDWPLAAVLITAILSVTAAYCTHINTASDADLRRIFNDLRTHHTRISRLEDKQNGKTL